MMKTVKNIFLTLSAMLVLGIFSVNPAQAQNDPQFLSYPFSHLDWYTIESERFLIHFQEGNDRPARVISRIAEEVWNEITELYDFEPDTPLSIVLIDREDYSNGAAYFYDNKIEIWLPALDTPLRGTNDWLRNVITHEFTHIVQIQAGMSRNRRWPMTYIQWLSYEDVRRPDVLYGYPSGIITYPFASVSVPAWFAEGTAQFMRDGLYYDTFDSHRDMLLRTHVLDDKQLGLVEMGHFSSKTSMERELAYNMGFSFTQYLSNRFGEEVLADITRATSRHRDIRNAMRAVTGIRGDAIYNDWVDSLRTSYTDFTENIRPFEDAESVEEWGFFNFSPTFTPDGRIAYLSNKGFDFPMSTLWIKDQNGESVSMLDFGDNQNSGLGFRHSCGLYSEPILSRIGNGFTFSPDGEHIIYNKIRQNRFGETYNDLYLYNIQSEDSDRLTQDGRLSEPDFSPDGSEIVVLQLRDGSQNISIYNPETDSLRVLTSQIHGEQFYAPKWSADGNTIFAAQSRLKGRRLVQVDPQTGAVDVLLDIEGVDTRDPFPGPDGEHLYFSMDHGGKFDLYRMHLETREIRRLTDVVGGAFMPNVSENGEMLYSEFTSGGYKIRKARVDDLLAFHDEVMETPQLSGRTFALNANELNTFDDSDIYPFSSTEYAVADTAAYNFSLATRNQADNRSFYAYEDTFLSFSFMPVIRFDNYSKEYGSNSNLIKAGQFGDLGRNILRDTKVGFYMASREVRERFSLFGGLLVGPASREAETIDGFFTPQRLIDLDRDLFLIAEYTGLPFIDRHWSPTISISLFNLRRNVKDGIEIEEFSCTACLPDTTSIDIAYDIWQAEISLLSKINRFSMVELGYHYSPYRVSTETFFSNEFQQTVPGSTSRYFIGSTYTAAYIVRSDLPYRHGDIAPVGFRGHIRYSYEPSRLLDNYEVRDGTLIPVYNDFKNHSVEVFTRFGIPLRNYHNLQLRSRFFTYFSQPDEYFFLDYIGGFDGMRSYPFFALGGNTTAYSQLSYLLPVKTNINRQSGRFILDKIFTRFFVEVGNGWGGPLDIGDNIKTGVGAELRVALNSNYLLPTRFFISGAYGLNEIDLRVPEGFVTAGSQDRVTFGREVQINFGVLFDFEF